MTLTCACVRASFEGEGNETPALPKRWLRGEGEGEGEKTEKSGACVPRVGPGKLVRGLGSGFEFGLAGSGFPCSFTLQTRVCSCSSYIFIIHMV